MICGDLEAGGGVENVLSGGESDDTTINFGGVENASGPVVRNTTINTGDVENVIRLASELTTIDGGVENVLATGESHQTTINTGGVENVNNGGVSRATTINEGGTENVRAGGASQHTTINEILIVVWSARPHTAAFFCVAHLRVAGPGRKLGAAQTTCAKQR
jgi:autotransporter passenger strand-loop-strand repeat protein